jgi:hypothetical protein
MASKNINGLAIDEVMQFLNYSFNERDWGSLAVAAQHLSGMASQLESLSKPAPPLALRKSRGKNGVTN